MKAFTKYVRVRKPRGESPVASRIVRIVVTAHIAGVCYGRQAN